jgi:hypothetical protein
MVRDIGHQNLDAQHNTTCDLYFPDKVCPHTSEAFKSPHFYEHFNPAIASFRSQSKVLQRCGLTYKPHRCKACPTEVTLDIELRDHFSGNIKGQRKSSQDAGGCVISYSGYVCFGRLMDPDDQEWKALTTWIEKPCRANKLLPGWPGYEAPAGLARRPTIDVTNMKPTSVRFRRHLEAAELRESGVVNVPIAPPPPYQADMSQAAALPEHCRRKKHIWSCTM